MIASAITLGVSLLRLIGWYTLAPFGQSEEDEMTKNLQIAAMAMEGWLTIMSAVALAGVALCSMRTVRLIMVIPWILAILCTLGLDAAYSAKVLEPLIDNDFFDDPTPDTVRVLVQWATVSLLYLMLAIISLIGGCLDITRNKHNGHPDTSKF